LRAGETLRFTFVIAVATLALPGACHAAAPTTHPVFARAQQGTGAEAEAEAEAEAQPAPGFAEFIGEVSRPAEQVSDESPPFPVWDLKGVVTMAGGGDRFSAPGLVGDPDTKLVDGTWHLFVSIGDPAGKLGPNLHHTTSADPGGPFLDTKWRDGRWPRVILDPRDRMAMDTGDTYRCETISVEVLPDGGAVALYCGTPGPSRRRPAQQDWFIYRATAESIDAHRWTRTGACMSRDLPWEMGWVDRGQWRGILAESGLFWCRGYLFSVYAAQNRRGWRIGLAASPDHGRTWLKKSEPILEPNSGYNMVSHGNVAALSDGWFLLTYIKGGRAGHRTRGICQAMTRDPWNGPWIEDPSNPVLSDEVAGLRGAEKGHVGSPSVEEDVARGRLVMHFHKKSETPAGVPGPRMRGQVLWAESRGAIGGQRDRR